MLIKKDAHPPGGWTYVQPQTGWKLFDAPSYDDAINNIIAHRNNSNGRPNITYKLSTDRKDVENDLQLFTCHRLGWDSQWCDKKDQNGQPIKVSAGVALSGKTASIQAALRPYTGCRTCGKNRRA